MTNKEEAILEIRKALARKSFFHYCELMHPKFYKRNRSYLINLCNSLQDFYTSDDDVLIINMPPRHGKSFTAKNYVEWMLGNHPEAKIMTGSYSERLSTIFSKSVRNTIQEVKADNSRVVYSDLFPKTKIKYGDASMSMWSLEGSSTVSYLATSPNGTATGVGASLIIVDDIIKNAEERYNDLALEKQYDWFRNTMLSRLEEGGKIIIIMTRWSSKDLAGRVLNEFKDAMKIKHINMTAVQKDGSMLCDEVLSRKSYDMKVKAMGKDIAEANYNQNPLDLKGRLYEHFSTYDTIPKDSTGTPLFEEVRCYCDTADTGADYLCAIVYAKYQRYAYVLDVLYTKEGMEVTEEALAEMLYRNRVAVCDIESNNGGRGFSRNVRRILEEKYPEFEIYVRAFHQSKNKQARIYSNSAFVMNNVLYPANWTDIWDEYYIAMSTYQKEGKNKHDDAPDATTGVAEKGFGRASVALFE